MNILVTGAAGRLGSILCSNLHRDGRSFKATDRSFDPHSPVPLIIANLLDREKAYELLDGVETLIHLGNHSNPGALDSQRLFNENMSMNINLFQAGAELGLKKIIFASSIQVIGGKMIQLEEGMSASSCLPYLPIDGDTPPNPGNTYALSKTATESALLYYVKNFGLAAIAVRLPWLLDTKWAERIRERRKKFSGKPRVQLDEGFAYLFQEDAAALLQAILDADLPGYRCYQAAARTPHLNEPIAEIYQQFFANVPLKKPLEKLKSLVDISRITAETGWVPRMDLWEGTPDDA